MSKMGLPAIDLRRTRKVRRLQKQVALGHVGAEDQDPQLQLQRAGIRASRRTAHRLQPIALVGADPAREAGQPDTVSLDWGFGSDIGDSFNGCLGEGMPTAMGAALFQPSRVSLPGHTSFPASGCCGSSLPSDFGAAGGAACKPYRSSAPGGGSVIGPHVADGSLPQLSSLRLQLQQHQQDQQQDQLLMQLFEEEDNCIGNDALLPRPCGPLMQVAEMQQAPWAGPRDIHAHAHSDSGASRPRPSWYDLDGSGEVPPTALPFTRNAISHSGDDCSPAPGWLLPAVTTALAPQPAQAPGASQQQQRVQMQQQWLSEELDREEELLRTGMKARLLSMRRHRELHATAASSPSASDGLRLGGRTSCVSSSLSSFSPTFSTAEASSGAPLQQASAAQPTAPAAAVSAARIRLACRQQAQQPQQQILQPLLLQQQQQTQYQQRLQQAMPQPPTPQQEKRPLTVGLSALLPSGTSIAPGLCSIQLPHERLQIATREEQQLQQLRELTRPPLAALHQHMLLQQRMTPPAQALLHQQPAHYDPWLALDTGGLSGGTIAAGLHIVRQAQHSSASHLHQHPQQQQQQQQQQQMVIDPIHLMADQVMAGGTFGYQVGDQEEDEDSPSAAATAMGGGAGVWGQVQAGNGVDFSGLSRLRHLQQAQQQTQQQAQQQVQQQAPEHLYQRQSWPPGGMPAKAQQQDHRCHQSGPPPPPQPQPVVPANECRLNGRPYTRGGRQQLRTLQRLPIACTKKRSLPPSDAMSEDEYCPSPRSLMVMVEACMLPGAQ